MSDIKLCIWMNIPSHHQKPFFECLSSHKDIDLEVRYLSQVNQMRSKEGWTDSYQPEKYEKFISSSLSSINKLETVADYADRIHIISFNFDEKLVKLFCQKKLNWCHWSEMYGINLAEFVSFNKTLFNLLRPILYLIKRKEIELINKYSLGAYTQGELGRLSFAKLGINQNKICHLYYSPKSLSLNEGNKEIKSFAQNKKVILCVAALTKRKGIDLLLESFSKINNKSWCLVICGLDKSQGAYQRLASSLGVSSKVLFLGAISIENMSEVYSAADIFVLPTRFDGWGAVLNEAASIGLPLISTNMCGASWHLIHPGENGFRIKENSIKALTWALNHYVNDHSLIIKHGNQSKLIFEKEFTPESNVQRLIDGLNKWMTTPLKNKAIQK